LGLPETLDPIPSENTLLIWQQSVPTLIKTLTATVVFLVLAGIAAVSWITISEFRVQQAVYSKILQQKLEATRSQFRMYLTPFPNVLSTLDQWNQTGLIDLQDPTRLEGLIVPLVDSTPQVASVYLIPDSGPYFCLTRTDNGWQASTENDADQFCRAQGWYQQILGGETNPSIHWSEYVTLPGLGIPGLVGGISSGSLILALGMEENFLDQFTATAPITENGILVRRYEDGSVAWLTPKQGKKLRISSSSELLSSGLVEHQIMGSALLAWAKLDRPYHEPFQFRRDDQTWWCTFYPAVEGTDPGELGLIAPASDLGRRLETVTGRVTWLFAGVLGLAMLAVVMQAFLFARKWRRLTRRRLKPPTSEEDLESLVTGGESDFVEFKSTMRWNLHANKAGKEIEKAWLKSVVAYLNTNGGFLLIGVADDGGILGLESDKFPNEDKFLLHFDNLIKQHIGLQFASYIKAEIRSLGEKKILLIACDRCPDPVYLKIADTEEFYIRMGPSTRVLPGSRVIDYLKEREG
jgi:type II secretory pathway pseudopilin PulG